MKNEIGYRALDGEVLKFEVPKNCNLYLVERAIRRLHSGEDADLVGLGLTRKETEFVAMVAAELEAHRPERAA